MDVLLFSSGIDSLLADWTLKKKGITTLLVYYATRSRCCQAEIQNMNERKLPVVMDVSLNLSTIEKPDAFVPNRNLLMAMHASGAYNPDVIYVGGTKADRVNDNNKEIMDELSSVITHSLGRDVKVTSPFWNKYKIEVAKEFVAEDPAHAELLKQTFSCYDPVKDDNDNWTECFRCGACFRKSVILFNAASHARSFKTPHIVKKYEKEFSELKDDEQTPRSLATLRYIEWLRNPT